MREIPSYSLYLGGQLLPTKHITEGMNNGRLNPKRAAILNLTISKITYAWYWHSALLVQGYQSHEIERCAHQVW